LNGGIDSLYTALETVLDNLRQLYWSLPESFGFSLAAAT